MPILPDIYPCKPDIYPCKPDIFEATYAPETKLQQQGKCLYQIDEPQAKALRLAHTLSGGKLIDDSTEWADTLHAAAAELRSQHARIAELEDVADMAIKRIAELEAQLSATHPTQHGLEQFIEQTGDVHFQRCRVGSKEGEIRWDIEFGHYGAEVRGKTLREAITKALAVQAKKEGEKR